MSVDAYLNEDGSGPYAQWHVPDLVSPARDARLVFVFESPHVDELRSRLPVDGSAGKSALRFLLEDQPRGLSLGRFVQQRRAVGDHRVAVLNVSNVPMQDVAFVESEAPDLEQDAWTLLERVRRSTARSVSSMRGVEARMISELLARGLRDRLSRVADTENRVVAAGSLAQRMVAAALPDLQPEPLHVPHPSFNQWHRVANQEKPDLITLRDLFRAVHAATTTPR